MTPKHTLFFGINSSFIKNPTATMCCVKGDKVFIKVNYTQNYANTKAARPFTSDTIVWLYSVFPFFSKQLTRLTHTSVYLTNRFFFLKIIISSDTEFLTQKSITYRLKPVVCFGRKRLLRLKPSKLFG